MDMSFFSSLGDTSGSTTDTTGINYGALSAAITPVPSTTSTSDSTGVNYDVLSGAISPVINSSGSSTSPVGDTSASSDVFSGLSDIFGAVGNAVSQGLKASNQPGTSQIVRPGQLLYNSATGQYVSTGVPVTSAGVVGGLNSQALMLVIVAVIAYFLFFRRRAA